MISPKASLEAAFYEKFENLGRASETQQREMRKAFYMGAVAAMNIVGQVFDETPDWDSLITALTELHIEALRELSKMPGVVIQIIRNTESDPPAAR